MKLSKDIQFPAQTHQDQWETLKQFTDARIAIGRTGCSIPTRALLDFQLSHAQAKDAVFQCLNVELLTEQLQQLGLNPIHVQSQAEHKELYLKRPDLGRLLAPQSVQQLQQTKQHQQGYDVCIVIGDGLSARAIEENALPFIQALIQPFAEQQWSLAPVVIATGSRVALGDEIAEIFQARMLIMLIGERPGLSSPDSMGLYYTLDAYSGCLDSQRNCISNIRPAGLSIPIATQRLLALMHNSKRLGLSGVDLKDEHVVPTLEDNHQPKLLF
ncbi:ethanolamine ammonia-lyase subunit EutC [Acinetobacter colistiniresistens]|uniref:Ethanolamine ammonia-lyase small subunit n=1 Tax=Acinetobacter colistiniresistens TaxID=280145 RepID=S3T906_9GAMM|nr:ethanolamine ammonia-lyase subunit EutC [Acinetobacter colistiniresistens]EPG37398.1 ethanolamine ammonia-lyase small subunit [Acinetobacter colistiniresistens]